MVACMLYIYIVMCTVRDCLWQVHKQEVKQRYQCVCYYIDLAWQGWADTGCSYQYNSDESLHAWLWTKYEMDQSRTIWRNCYPCSSNTWRWDALWLGVGLQAWPHICIGSLRHIFVHCPMINIMNWTKCSLLLNNLTNISRYIPVIMLHFRMHRMFA